MEYIERARKVAAKSSMQFRLAALVVHNGTIVAEGYNKMIEYFSHQYSLHAEVSALSKLKHMSSATLSEYVMYVYRFSATGETKLSKPCASCQKAIAEMRIQKIYFTIDKI